MHIHFGHRRHHGGPLSYILGIAFMLAGGGGGVTWWATREAPPPEPPAMKAAAALVPQGPVMALLQEVGGPTCSAKEERGERWVYAAAEGPRPGCEPADGDLVVWVDGEVILRFQARHGEGRPVESLEDLHAFQLRYGPHR